MWFKNKSFCEKGTIEIDKIVHLRPTNAVAVKLEIRVYNVRRGKEECNKTQIQNKTKPQTQAENIENIVLR